MKKLNLLDIIVVNVIFLSHCNKLDCFNAMVVNSRESLF